LFSFYGERERERDESDNNVDVLLLQEEVINGAMRDHRERERDRDRDRDRFPKRLVDLYQV
jgi:aspartyl/asparaginyl-tRNA synthetase